MNKTQVKLRILIYFGLLGAFVLLFPPWKQTNFVFSGDNFLNPIENDYYPETKWVGFAPIFESPPRPGRRGGPVSIYYTVWFYEILLVVSISISTLCFYPYLVHRKGFCSNCSYNLKGTLKAGRSECPECGEIYEAQRTDFAKDGITFLIITGGSMLLGGCLGFIVIPEWRAALVSGLAVIPGGLLVAAAYVCFTRKTVDRSSCLK